MKRPVEVDHVERDDWVLLASLTSQRQKWRVERNQEKDLVSQTESFTSDLQDWGRWRNLLTFG